MLGFDTLLQSYSVISIASAQELDIYGYKNDNF